MSAVHIAGKLNASAGNKSRNFSDQHECSLSKEYFKEIISAFPELNIDLFASRLNSQLDTLIAHGNQIKAAPILMHFQ